MTEPVGQIEEYEDIIPLEPEPEPVVSRAVVDPSIPPPSAKSRMRMLEECEHMEHEAYHVPFVMLVVGLLAALVITPLAAAFGPMAGGRPWLELGVYAMTFTIGVGLGLLLNEVCSIFGIVTEAPWKLTALRIAATFAVSDVVAIVCAMLLKTPFIPEVGALIVFYVLIRWYEDLEAQDAAVITIVLYLPKFFIGLWLGMKFGLL